MKIKSIYVIVINTQAGASNSKLISLTHMGTCCNGKKNTACKRKWVPFLTFLLKTCATSGLGSSFYLRNRGAASIWTILGYRSQ